MYLKASSTGGAQGSRTPDLYNANVGTILEIGIIWFHQHFENKGFKHIKNQQESTKIIAVTTVVTAVNLPSKKILPMNT